ncbi:HEXXH motif-containing putative peptide modification protein [Nocardia sp. XZ_19_385]|uniref:aKG-HExxH-type peptide beta-hydroxylase n=1 Tax=Nocardia sp. XZ_19_385 TaxID=2769488 RepID=UPI00188F7B29|nr:HEXXH motif-containing putative peptide modification protein [Nocardia sp. XZ_19_385]
MPEPRAPNSPAFLTISDECLDSFATLNDAPGSAELLERAQLSRNLAFLAGVLGAGAADRLARDGFALLVDVQRHDPALARKVLSHPRFGAWAAACATGSGPETEVAHLASFAAAAAVSARMEFGLDVPVVGDSVVLPGLGCWSGSNSGTARIRTSGGVPAVAGWRWTPLRKLTARTAHDQVEVEFDDLPATPSAWPDVAPVARWHPWDSTEFEVWQEHFAVALPRLMTVVPELAEPVRRGLRSILPRPRVPGAYVSSTLVDAFGSAAMVLPPDAASTAVGLLHEFQHSKLGVLLELRPLIAVDGPADLPSPWRAEPRPASALLHGVYAHCAVARFLLRDVHRQGLPPRPEGRGFSAQTVAACETLLDSGRLTRSGRRFVRLLRKVTVHDANSIGGHTI